MIWQLMLQEIFILQAISDTQLILIRVLAQ